MRFISYLIILLFAFSCSEKTSHEISGEAQGTWFSIKYHGSTFDASSQVDSILNRMDDQFSTYKESSVISNFNASAKGVKINEEFLFLWEKCWEVNIETNGFFDPTLAPVLNLYSESKGKVDSNSVKNSLGKTGMQLISAKEGFLFKKVHEAALDFNGIAQGFTVDLICELLESSGVDNYLVEVGGEIKAKGKNSSGHLWKVGIDRPMKGNKRALSAKFELLNTSLATSGNYRKFHEVDGRIIGHIIDPKTGFPAETNILSASVFTENCFRADALATALMNMPLQEALEMDNEISDISVFLIYLSDSDTLTYSSPDLKKYKLD